MRYEKPLARVRTAIDEARGSFETYGTRQEETHARLLEAVEELADVVDRFIREHST